MADVIARLKVDSKEYDSKIQRATSGLLAFEKQCQSAGKSMADASKDEVEFAQSLGQMDTVASSATGKLGELKKAFTELSIQYQNLTKEEKQSPYGKALAGSLEQLKGRIGDLGGKLGNVGKELNGSKGFVTDFANALGSLGPAGQMAGKLIQGAFGPIGIAIAAVVGVVKQLVDAFKRNEDAMASAERAAAPFKAIWNQIQRLFDKLVPHIASGIEKISDAMQSLFSKFTEWINKLGDTAIGKKLGFDKLSEQLKKAASEQAELTAANKQIANSENELNKLRRSSAEANARDEQKIAKLRADASEKDKYSAAERIKMLEEAGALEENIMKRDVTLKQKELDLIRLKSSLTSDSTEELNEESAAQVALTQATTAYYEKKRALQKQLQAARNEDAKDQASGESPADGSIAAQEEKVKDLTEKWKNATEELRDGYKKELDEAQAVLDQMLGKTESAVAPKAIKDAASMWTEYTDKLADVKARLEEFKAMVNDSSLTDAQRSWAEGMAESYQEELNKMMGATDEAVASMKDSLSNLSSGVSAISEIGNAFNDLKGIGEDLASAFSGEMDAWDALMTVFNSGISIMQTVIGVMEAINTLTEVSSALKKANTIATETEAATSVSAAATEAGAESTKAGANMLTAGTAAAASSAEAGESVAGIPFVGPILAVAAIAAVLAATFAAISKAKSSAKGFASGGIVGGSSYSGDNIVARLNSGEGVLTAQGVQNAAAMANSSNPMQNLQLSTEISGTNLRFVMNNDNRSKGGDRTFYSRIH